MKSFTAVVLGAGGVGKSALTIRFCRSVFTDTYDPTIEEYYRRPIELDGDTSMVEVLDTAGTEQFTTLNEGYLKSGHGFVLCFSLTQKATLREVESLREQLGLIRSRSVPIVVVGTKLDLREDRQVSREAIQDLAARWRVPVYETSAKRDWQVTEVFEDLLRQMRARYRRVEEHRPETTRVEKKRQKCIVM